MSYIDEMYIGLDIGGTKIEGRIFQGSHLKELFKLRVPTLRDEGLEPVLKRIFQLIIDLLKETLVSNSDLLGIGIGMPGSVHPQKQIQLNGNSKIFSGVSLKERIQNELKINCPILLANDANCFALAEAVLGVGKNHPPDAIGMGIILGTGLGGGLIIQGKIIEGAKGGASELGHSLLVSKGRRCFCGRLGCAEGYLSGSGLEQSYFELTGQNKKSKEIFSELDSDEKAKIIIREYKDHLQEFLLNITNIFDPDYFVLGGGVSNQEIIYEGLEEYIRKNSFVPDSSPKVYRNSLGDSAGVFGAALLPFLNKG